MRFLCYLLLLIIAGCAFGANKPAPEVSPAKNESAELKPIDMTNSLNKLSYAAGYRLGDMFQNQKLTIVPDAVQQGMLDARKNRRPALTKAEIRLILQDPKTFLAADYDALKQKTLEEGEAYLEKNAQREGVVVLQSGLQYRVLSAGRGKSPQATDRVRYHSKGRNLSGFVFDNTYTKGVPAETAIIGVLPGMAEALPLMQEGSRWELSIPADLAYGDQGPLAHQTLVFEVELLAILPPDSK